MKSSLIVENSNERFLGKGGFVKNDFRAMTTEYFEIFNFYSC